MFHIRLKLPSLFANSITLFAVILQLVLCLLFSIGIISPFYFVGGELVILFGMLFLTKPRVALMVFLLLRPILDYLKPYSDIQFQIYSSINLVALSTALILVFGLFYILINRINLFRQPLVKPFLLFIAVCFISIFISPLKIEGFFDWMRLASLFVFYILILNMFNTAKDIDRLIKIIFISAVIPLLVGFYQSLTHTGSLEVTGYFRTISFHRIFSTFTHPNVYAFYLVILLPMCILLFMESKNRWRKVFLGILILALCLSLILTFTRGAWISFIFAVLAFGILKHRKALIFILLGILVLSLLMPGISKRFKDLTDTSIDGTNSFTWRLKLWRQTFDYFLAKPILGYGLGSFYKLSSATQGEYAAAHNDYLRLAVEIGVVGLGIYVFLLFALLRSAFSIYRRLSFSYLKAIALGVFSICVAYLAIGLADNLVRSTVVQLYFWTFAAIMFNARRIEERINECTCFNQYVSL